jgi:RecB family exonuclease
MIKLSASSIGTYEKCPKKYYYQYIEKPPVPEQDWSHLEFGKCAHRALELFHKDLCQNVRGPEEYSQVMRESVKAALKEFDMDILKPELPALKEVLQSYLDKINSFGLPQVIANELNFDFKIGEYTVRGFIDRIDKIAPGHYKVVDYKTNKNPKYLSSFQLLLYALAIKEVYPDAQKIDGAYVLLKHKCDTLEFQFSEKDYEETILKIKTVGLSIDTSEEWEKRPSILCNWCDYQSICQNSWDV